MKTGMTTLRPNLRKAAVLIRSLDADSAAALLAQLSPAEVDAVRQALGELEEFDDDERADVASEMRRAAAATVENRHSGVEVTLSAYSRDVANIEPTAAASPSAATDENRFAFLDQEHLSDLAPLLTREHPQTVAVILSMLDPSRAAGVLRALPAAIQPHVLERLADLGDTDPDSLQVIERELQAWVARQPLRPTRVDQHSDHAFRILAAAEPAIRIGWVAELRRRNRTLADRLSATLPSSHSEKNSWITKPKHSERIFHEPPGNQEVSAAQPRVPVESSAPTQCIPDDGMPAIAFGQLAAVDSKTMAAIFREVDAPILKLALAGADEVLVDRVADQLPKATARQFRASLHQLGPTRLSDVTAAQQLVATVATRILAQRRTSHFMNA